MGGDRSQDEDWFERVGDIRDVSDVTHVVYRAFDGRVGILN